MQNDNPDCQMTSISIDSTSRESPSEEVIHQWVHQARQGSEEAFACLVKTFEGRLQALIYRILLDWEESRDVAQETFVRAYRALNRYQQQGKFQSWLFQIGVRCAYDVLRKKKHRLFNYREDQILPEVGVEDEEIKKKEITTAIEQAVQQLPSKQRIAFVLAEYEGFGYREIAEVLGGTSKAAERHLHRARIFLREKLKPYFC